MTDDTPPSAMAKVEALQVALGCILDAMSPEQRSATWDKLTGRLAEHDGYLPKRRPEVARAFRDMLDRLSPPD